QKEIKKDNPNDFHGIDAKKLTLWKVNIPDDADATAIQQLVLKDDEAKGINMMRPSRKIEIYFGNQPAYGYIHVIVERPPGKCPFSIHPSIHPFIKYSFIRLLLCLLFVHFILSFAT